MASFAVVAMVKPDPFELRLFIDHYLGCGASQLLIYNDGPIDHLVTGGLVPEDLARQGVTLVALDDAFWADEPGGRPVDFIERRVAVHAHGKAHCTADWLFICDEDEFLLSEVPIHAALDEIPEGTDSVVVPLGEAAWGPGDDLDQPFGSTWFRLPYVGKDQAEWKADKFRIYGPAALLISQGVVSHALSKQFVRSAAEFELVDTHRSYRDGKNVSVEAGGLGGAMARIVLLHFDAIGYDRWLRKWAGRKADPTMNRSARPVRRRQAQLIPRAVGLGPRTGRALFRVLYGLTKRQTRMLQARGRVFRAYPFKGRIPYADHPLEG